LARLSRRFEMRRIVRAKAAALEAEILVWRLGRRDGAGKLGDGNGMLLVANVDDPIGQIDLIAVGVGGFAIRDDEAAFEDAAIDRVEGDTHAGILRRRFEAADFFLMRGIGEIENDEAVAAERAVAAIAAVFQLFRNIHWAVETGERSLVGNDFRRDEFRPNPLVVFGFFALAGAGNPPHGNFFGAGRIGAVDNHVAVDEPAEVGRLVDERFVGRRVKAGVLSAVVIIAMRALAGGASAEFGELDNLRGIGGVVEANAAQALVVFPFVVEVRIVVLTHGRFGCGIGDGRLRAGHENPLFKALVVGDLDLGALEAAFVEHHRLANVAHVDDVTLLEEVATAADGHELHFAAAMLPGSEVGEEFHVVDVHAAVEVGEAVGSGVAVVVGPSREGRTGESEACTRRGAKELAAGGEKRAAPGSRRLAADGFGGPVLETLAGRHRSRLLGFGWPKVGGSRQKGMTAVPLGAKLCQGIFKHSSGILVSRAVVEGKNGV